MMSGQRPNRIRACIFIGTNPSSQSAIGGFSTRSSSSGIAAASWPVGRVIFTVGALPAVRVMNFILVDQVIVLRTAADTTITRKVHDAIVAFEADDLDPATSSGWSVTVTGRATLVTDSERIDRYQHVSLVPWASEYVIGSCRSRPRRSRDSASPGWYQPVSLYCEHRAPCGVRRCHYARQAGPAPCARSLGGGSAGGDRAVGRGQGDDALAGADLAGDGG